MDEPQTYEDALAIGFEEIDEEEARRFKRERAKAMQTKGLALESPPLCTSANVGMACLDWTNDEGVRIICFCTRGRTCGNCVKKKVR